MNVRLERSDRAAPFLARVADFLGAREAEHNLLFGILDSLSRDATGLSAPPYFAAALDADRVVAVALRTPPFNLVLSEIDDPAVIPLIVEDRLAAGDSLPGVVGPVAAAREFAAAWTDATGQPSTVRVHERIFRLTAVVPPREVAGAIRQADSTDADTLTEWLLAFTNEALPGAPTSDASEMVQRWLRSGTKRNYFWEVGGRPVSWAGVGGRTPNGTRIGPVYTPPPDRGRGYASAVVAAASQLQLDEGLRFCFLFTDLANPTANHVYEAIGYEPVADVDEWSFG